MEEVRAAQFGGAFVTAVERHEGGTSPLPSFRPSNYNIGPPYTPTIPYLQTNTHYLSNVTYFGRELLRWQRQIISMKNVN